MPIAEQHATLDDDRAHDAVAVAVTAHRAGRKRAGSSGASAARSCWNSALVWWWYERLMGLSPALVGPVRRRPRVGHLGVTTGCPTSPGRITPDLKCVRSTRDS